MFSEHTLFRANPAYELVLLDRLPPEEKQRIVAIEPAGDDLYGVLRPSVGARLEMRSVCPDTALLFLSLLIPGPLPGYLRARLGGDVVTTVCRLVLDGVLEVHDGHRYVAGPAATTVLTPAGRRGGRGRIAELSLAALRYGQALAGLDESSLAQRLYAYGRRPVSPELQRRFADEAAIMEALGIADGPVADALEQMWVAAPPPATGPAFWRQWRPRRRVGEMPDSFGARFKLYVSPDLNDLGRAVAAVATALAGAPGIQGFKVGRRLADLCRPDVLVAYFSRLDDLHEAAAELRAPLAGCPAHGVPFTAQVTADGLLTWGIDTAGTRATGQTSTSWRMRITQHLAESLIVYQTAPPVSVEPWLYALERLSATGVDVETWAPAGRARASTDR